MSLDTLSMQFTPQEPILYNSTQYNVEEINLHPRIVNIQKFINVIIICLLYCFVINLPTIHYLILRLINVFLSNENKDFTNTKYLYSMYGIYMLNLAIFLSIIFVLSLFISDKFLPIVAIIILIIIFFFINENAKTLYFFNIPFIISVVFLISSGKKQMSDSKSFLFIFIKHFIFTLMTDCIIMIIAYMFDGDKRYLTIAGYGLPQKTFFVISVILEIAFCFLENEIPKNNKIPYSLAKIIDNVTLIPSLGMNNLLNALDSDEQNSSNFGPNFETFILS